MTKIDKLVPGQEVFEDHWERAGNTTMRRWGVWSLHVVSVDLARQVVKASWNGNAVRDYYWGSWKKWKLVHPCLAIAKTIISSARKTWAPATDTDRQIAETLINAYAKDRLTQIEVRGKCRYMSARDEQSLRYMLQRTQD